MNSTRWLPITLLTLACMAGFGCGKSSPSDSQPSERTFSVKGIVRKLQPEQGAVSVQHEEIPGFMAAMTMSFRVRDVAELSGISSGDHVEFQLHVTSIKSWVTDIKKVGQEKVSAVSAPSAAPPPPPPPVPGAPAAPAVPPPPPAPKLGNFIADIVFTNQLGREVRWREFDGNAVGFTFFFTRCPLPEYCPRLARNFAGAQQKLVSDSSAPTNWHLVSITIDPAFDSPRVLNTYAQAYGADPARWSFLTASPTNIARLAQMFGLSYQATNNTIDHDFRTVVLDASGRVQAVWPIGGDTTDTLVGELIKGMKESGGR